VFISSRNEARRSARSAAMIAPRLCRPRKTTCLCGALLVRLRRPCGEPLVLGRDYGTTIFAAIAVLGVKRSPWFLAIGMVLHGLTWDTWHYKNSTYIPDWYVIACLAVDLALGAYVAARVPAYQRASRIETQN
jgi:hypothetical protein